MHAPVWGDEEVDSWWGEDPLVIFHFICIRMALDGRLSISILPGLAILVYYISGLGER